MPCRQPVAPGRVAVEPNSFVLAPGCSMKVMVAMSPSQREVDLVKTRKEVVAVVRFQHGDEVMRQKYLRAYSREGGGDAYSWQAAFRQPFANEAQDSVILEGSSIVDMPDDTSAFLHQLGSLCVALLAQPHPGQQGTSMSVSSLLHTPATHRDSASSLPTHDTTFPHAREDSRHLDSTGQFLVPGRPDDDKGDWTVKPDFLSLTVGENNQKMLQLISFSKHPLSFELSWPPSSVVPEPKKGDIKPRSRLSIEVWLHMSWQQRLSELPWRGAIVITCNGQEKNVRVTVQKPAQSPRLPLSSPHTSPTSLSTRSTQATPSADRADHSLHLASSNIHFAKAKVNTKHESMLELTNASMEPVTLKLSPFAPAYVKGSDETNTVKRVTYSAFNFTSTTADLLPQETLKVPVKFCPQTKGTFNQHWEIEYWPLTSSKRAAQNKKATRISLTAEVAEVEVSCKKLTWDPVEQNKTGVASSRTPLQEKHPNTADPGEERGPVATADLRLMQSDVMFDRTRVGRVSQVKVEFKNSLDSNVQIEVDPPSPPFRIKHQTFRITKKRVLKYPIEFSPVAAGSFVDKMTFRASELGKTFTVHLKGTAV
ncbi:centrosomal protein of 192 kDa-like [Babylonia areolata]|uniref:centrosomal protein of 192 kDa-like n=1 Tax=Babylonia areolata TaxID=304850 RepID=UPI003FD69900